MNDMCLFIDRYLEMVYGAIDRLSSLRNPDGCDMQ